MLRPLLQNKNYHSIWHKPVQISGRNLCFFIYSSVHTNFGGHIKVLLVLRKVALADSCVGIVITQGSAHATLRSTRTTLDQIIIENYVGVRLLFQGILSLICTIHILEISTFDNTVQLHEVLVCNEVMFPFPGLLGHNTNLRLLQNIIRLLLLPNLTYTV